MINWTDTLTAKDYLALRSAAGWTALCEEQAQAGLDNTDHILAGYDGEKIAAAARVLWDKGHVAYLCDVIVMPEYRGQGLGRLMVEDAIRWTRSKLRPGWRIKLVIISSKGKEPFYEKFGFHYRPNERFGAGMDRWVTADEAET